MCLSMLFGFCTFILVLPVESTTPRPEPILIAGNGPLESHTLNLIDKYFERLELPLNTNEKENNAPPQAAGFSRASLIGLIQKINASLLNDDSVDTSKHYIADVWSLIWYIGAFGGLVGFFMVVSCSECCCSIPPLVQTVSRSAAIEAATANQETRESICTDPEPPAPPPPYSLFAPPDYETLFYVEETEKKKNRLYIIPIHDSTSSRS